MKKLIKFAKRNFFSIYFRNKFNIKPTSNWDILKKYSYSSVSDSFLWRTDNGFSTKFRFTDILKLFYKHPKTKVELIFFDKKGKEIKSIEIEDLNISNEIIINSGFFNGIKDYGTFNIFHNQDENNENTTILNRCYLGYSKDEKFYSFVHGNALTSSKSKEKIIRKFYPTSFFTNINYNVQNMMSEFKKTEVIVNNPSEEMIQIYISNEKINLMPNETKIFDLTKDKVVKIVSNCHILRPIIFNYSNDSFDVYHG
jgi:hypothetical protein